MFNMFLEPPNTTKTMVFPTADACEIPHHQKNGFSTQSWDVYHPSTGGCRNHRHHGTVKRFPRLRRFLRCCFSLQGADHGGVGWFPKYGLYRLTMVKAWLDRLNPPKLFSGLFKCLALTYGLTNQKRIILATINKDKRIYLPQRKRI